ARSAGIREASGAFRDTNLRHGTAPRDARPDATGLRTATGPRPRRDEGRTRPFWRDNGMPDGTRSGPAAGTPGRGACAGGHDHDLCRLTRCVLPSHPGWAHRSRPAYGEEVRSISRRDQPPPHDSPFGFSFRSHGSRAAELTLGRGQAGKHIGNWKYGHRCSVAHTGTLGRRTETGSRLPGINGWVADHPSDRSSEREFRSTISADLRG